MSEISVFQTVVLFAVLGLATLWFTNLSLRALDILYGPRVRIWVRDRPLGEGNAELGSKAKPNSRYHHTASYVEELMSELALLRIMNQERLAEQGRLICTNRNKKELDYCQAKVGSSSGYNVFLGATKETRLWRQQIVCPNNPLPT